MTKVHEEVAAVVARPHESPSSVLVQPGRVSVRPSTGPATAASSCSLTAATAYLETCEVDFVWKNQTLSADGPRSTMIREPDGALVNVLCCPATP